MSAELTNDEKISIINQHLKNLAFSQYNLTLTLEESNAISSPNRSSIDLLNDQIKDIESQKAVLVSELDSLQSTSTTN